jgi:hypothetical protein
MVNQEELAICRRRGHDATFLGDGWIQCKWCGMWLRQRKLLDEQEDEPPQSEINLIAKFMEEEVGPAKQRIKQRAEEAARGGSGAFQE